MIVRGPPGSGKSVARRVAAQEVWSRSDPQRLPLLLPVLITFAELREHGFDQSAALADSLLRRRFGEQPDGGAAAARSWRSGITRRPRRAPTVSTGR